MIPVIVVYVFVYMCYIDDVYFVHIWLKFCSVLFFSIFLSDSNDTLSIIIKLKVIYFSQVYWSSVWLNGQLGVFFSRIVYFPAIPTLVFSCSMKSACRHASQVNELWKTLLITAFVREHDFIYCFHFSDCGLHDLFYCFHFSDCGLHELSKIWLSWRMLVPTERWDIPVRWPSSWHTI